MGMKRALKVIDRMLEGRRKRLEQAETEEARARIQVQMRTLMDVSHALVDDARLKELKKGPEWVYNSMDGSLFIRSLTKPEPGEVFEKDGNRFVVAYAWHWSDYNGVPVYMAELDSETNPRRPKKED